MSVISAVAGSPNQPTKWDKWGEEIDRRITEAAEGLSGLAVPRFKRGELESLRKNEAAPITWVKKVTAEIANLFFPHSKTPQETVANEIREENSFEGEEQKLNAVIGRKEKEVYSQLMSGFDPSLILL